MLAEIPATRIINRYFRKAVTISNSIDFSMDESRYSLTGLSFGPTINNVSRIKLFRFFEYYTL